MRRWSLIVLWGVLALSMNSWAGVLEKLDGVWVADKKMFLAQNPEIKKSYDTSPQARKNLDYELDGRGIWINFEEQTIFILNLKEASKPYSRGRFVYETVKEKGNRIELTKGQGQEPDGFALRLLSNGFLEFRKIESGHPSGPIEYYEHQPNFPIKKIRFY